MGVSFHLNGKNRSFGENFNEIRGGYVCPDCGDVFVGTNGLEHLEADHVIPFSKGGLTVWNNLILRCKRCNIAKSDTVC